MTDNAPTRREIAERLRREAVGVSLERSQFGVSRKLSNDQKEEIANLFDAEAHRLSAGKKLLNKRHKKYLRVTSALNRARDCWMDSTLPYPDPGIRLIRRDRVQDFDERMTAIRSELRAAAVELEMVYRSELIPEARETLGDVFDANDYPAEIAGEFDVQWGFPNVEPGEYLRQISPKLYEQEQERVRARFEEAISQAEQAFASEFANAVQHLVDRLTPGADGKEKTFKDTTVANLVEFFNRFGQLDVGSNVALTTLVEEAKAVVQGVDAKNLRKDATARGAIRESMQQLCTKLDAMIVARPKRKITLADEEPAAGEQQAEGGNDEPNTEAA